MVVIEGRPYSVLELYISGRLRGFIRARKESGFNGTLVVGASRVFYEYPGILMVGEPVRPAESKLSLSEDRKGFTVKTPDKTHLGLYEVNIKFEDVYAGFTAFFSPRRLTISVENAIVNHREGFAFLEVVFKPREVAAEARVTREVLE